MQAERHNIQSIHNAAFSQRVRVAARRRMKD
jgi:hypothetical protein